MAGYTTIVFGGVTLNITNMKVVRQPSTLKQKVGKVLVKVPIIGRDAFDYTLQISGIINGANLATLESNRLALEALDDVEYHDLTTGITTYDGTYIIDPGSLQWDDSSDDAQGLYRYSLSLIQYNQWDNKHGNTKNPDKPFHSFDYFD